MVNKCFLKCYIFEIYFQKTLFKVNGFKNKKNAIMKKYLKYFLCKYSTDYFSL